MYIRGLIPRTFAELAEAIPIDAGSCRVTVSDVAEKVGGNSTQYLSWKVLRDRSIVKLR